MALFTEKGRYDTDEQLQLLRAMQRGAQERGADLDRQARDSALALTEALLKAKKPERVRAGIEMVGLLKWKEKQDLLSRLVLLRSTPTDQRRTALDALLALDDRACVPVLVKVLNDPTAPIEVREHVASLLARLNRPKTRTAMGKALQVAPARLQRTIARLLANSREGGELLLDAVTRGKASARVLTQREVAGALQRARIANLKQRLVKLTRGLPAPDARLRTLLARHRQGYLKANPDVQRGLKAFTKHCAACHQVGDTGARVGPQLNGIGLRGLDRLLEDILDPNRNVDQAFRTTFLDLKNGRQHKGLLLKEEGELLVLVDSEGKQQRIPRKQVERRFHSALSPMPANLGEVIPEKTFYDLLCFLLSQR